MRQQFCGCVSSLRGLFAANSVFIILAGYNAGDRVKEGAGTWLEYGDV